MSSLELPDILDETAQFTEWYTLGVYLKLSKGELDDIEERLCRQGSKRCKIELFNLWMKTNLDASWEQLALALERCGETVLADRIRTHHPPPLSPKASAAADSHDQLSKAAEPQPAEPVPELSIVLHHQQSVFPSDQQHTTSTVSTPAAPAPVKILVGKEQVKQFTRLERSYASLSKELQSTLEEKQVSLVDLKRYLNELLRDEDLDQDLLQAASIDEVFRLIKPHYCFLNTTILRGIIEEFVGEPLKQKLEKYEIQREQFTESTVLSVLKEVESERLSTVEMPQVILKMAGYLANITIKHFQVLVSRFFGTESSSLANIHVKDGCICVSWFARRSTILGLVALAQQKMEFMRHAGVLRLKVGDTIILEQEREEEEEEDNDLHSALLRATTADCTQAVEFLLSIGADPNCASGNGDTPLISACRNESNSIANMLLTACANVNLQNKQGCTALIVVCHAEVPNESLVRMLVQAGAEVNIPSGEIQVSLPDEEKAVVMTRMTALMLAARGGHTNIVQYLLDEGADVNKLDAHGSSALMYASSHGHTETVRLLLNYGANVNKQMTKHCCTALMLASHGHNETVHLLLSHDATVNTQDKHGITALMIAAFLGFPEIIHLLLNYGANVSIQTVDNNTALHYACGQQRAVCVEFLLANGADPNIQNADGGTPLMFASHTKGNARDPAILVMLLSVGANPNTQTENDATALMFAATTSYQEGVEILLNAGASVYLRDSYGYTALHDAAQNGNLEIVELLLASGAQASVISNDGDTPLDLALDGGHDDVCQLLISSMESDPLNKLVVGTQTIRNVPKE